MIQYWAQNNRLRSTSFAPTSIANLAVWFDAADASSLTLDGSNNVSQWNDKSGNARHATQATTLNRPSYLTNQLNGYGAVRGNGSNTFMTFSSPSLADGYTLFAVFNSGSSTNLGIYGQFPTAASGNGVILGAGLYRTGRTGASLAVPTGQSTNTNVALVYRYDGSHTTGNFMLRGSWNATDTARSNTQDTATPAAGTASLLSYAAKTDSNFGSNLYEFAIYDRQLTTTERDQLQSYTTSKWGITWA